MRSVKCRPEAAEVTGESAAPVVRRCLTGSKDTAGAITEWVCFESELSMGYLSGDVAVLAVKEPPAKSVTCTAEERARSKASATPWRLRVR